MRITVPTDAGVRAELTRLKWVLDPAVTTADQEQWVCRDGVGMFILKSDVGLAWVQGWPSVLIPALKALGFTELPLAASEKSETQESPLELTITQFRRDLIERYGEDVFQPTIIRGTSDTATRLFPLVREFYGLTLPVLRIDFLPGDRLLIHTKHPVQGGKNS